MKTYCRQEISRGDIYYADLRPVIGSEQGGIRPVLILQNNVGNRHSPTVIAAPITSKMGKPRLPTPPLMRDTGDLRQSLSYPLNWWCGENKVNYDNCYKIFNIDFSHLSRR